MTKGERLIWGLFEMVRELMPQTQQNAARFQQWAAQFHEMEKPSGLTPTMEVETVKQEGELEDEPHEDPHEHGAPPRRRKNR